MPQIHRKGRIFVGRETATYGAASTAALPGVEWGPLSGMSTVALGAQASVAGLLIPTLTRELEAKFNKHQSVAQVGRRANEVSMVPGRRNSGGQFEVEVMPNSFGLLLFLLFGADVVTATASTTLTGAGNTANTTTLTLAANTDPGLVVNQYIFINDGANSEYVQSAGTVAPNGTSVPIKGGAGTGGGLKFTHATSTPIQIGPWTHVFSPAAGTPGTGQIEDNWAGLATSLLYTGQVIDQMDFKAPIESDTESLTAVFKMLGKAPSLTPVAASAVGVLPLEEVGVAAGAGATMSQTGSTDPTIWVPDFKMTYANAAKAGKSQVSSPDLYAAIGTNLSVKGSFESIVEDYGVLQDFGNNVIWQNALFTWAWPSALLAANPAVIPSLAFNIQRMALSDAFKESMKEEFTRYAANFAAQDYPDYTNLVTATLKSNVAAY